MIKSKERLIFIVLKTFFARMLAAFGSIILSVIVGRLYGATGLGAFALGQSIMIGCATFSRFGTNNSLILYINKREEGKGVLLYLVWALRIAIPISIFMAVGLYAFSDKISSFYSAKGLNDILIGMAVSTVPFTASFVFSGFMKGVRKPVIGSLLDNGMIALLASLITITLFLFFQENGFDNLVWGYAGAAWLVAIYGFYKVVSWMHVNNHINKINNQEESAPFYDSSRSFLILSLSLLSQTVFSIIIAARYLDGSELGLLKAAQQYSVVAGFVLIVMDSIFPARFAHAHSDNNIKELKGLAEASCFFSTIVALPFIIACWVAPETLLSFFGHDFSAAENVLRILILGQLFNVTTGSVGYILNMSGNEKVMRNIALFSNMVGLLAVYLLCRKWGLVGAAAGISFITILQNVLALYYVRRKVGIWVLPILRKNALSLS